jgi:hypothetical protein
MPKSPSAAPLHFRDAPPANRPTPHAGAPRAHGSAPTNRDQTGGNEGGGNLGFEVRGFATDPKHSGYQILTNYESTYWRAFVGVQAWSLYEVLRSFCHNGNNVCYPSINYLLEVLGIKQRRVLTGWSTEVKGKSYQYPGLIEILQGGGLVVAEMVGEGPMQRYLFHVNLTPDLLRPEQVAELPALLQHKHTEMLQAHFAEMAELASRRRPAKEGTPTRTEEEGMARSRTSPPRATQATPPRTQAANRRQPPRLLLQDEDASTKNMVEQEGMTNCQTGVTNCHTGGDNLSPKQHQSNNTQLTNSSSTNDAYNNSGGLQQELPLSSDSPTGPPKTDVVVALTTLGLADGVVQRLTTRFSRARILEKIDYLAYLEEYHPGKVKNARGWLRRAIEENYGAPDGYVNAADRAARREAPPEASPTVDGEARISYAAFVDNAAVEASRAAHATATSEREYLRAARREAIRRQHAPDAATLAFWELVQSDVRLTMPPDHYRLIAEASILWMDESRVAIAIWERELYRELLHPHRLKALMRSMSVLAKRKLEIVCEFWDEEGQVVPPGTPPPCVG